MNLLKYNDLFVNSNQKTKTNLEKTSELNKYKKKQKKSLQTYNKLTSPQHGSMALMMHDGGRCNIWDSETGAFGLARLSFGTESQAYVMLREFYKVYGRSQPPRY